ncbi:hypothetical protein THAOC_32417 [Thalassiosira oceanica]|uniref:Uncharacterized protein n=1 Tax=Thalassiosira oceanica TaxID=159749 RepID=K0R7A3_THAOC|nr:hypothetical protein THAOC_32417 [Thalassiosira oceanica]|eukprot:EJK48755.1 hypothetical protein THAOC_32417 [Thalassiosira oceanica]
MMIGRFLSVSHVQTQYITRICNTPTTIYRCLETKNKPLRSDLIRLGFPREVSTCNVLQHSSLCTGDRLGPLMITEDWSGYGRGCRIVNTKNDTGKLSTTERHCEGGQQPIISSHARQNDRAISSTSRKKEGSAQTGGTGTGGHWVQ